MFVYFIVLLLGYVAVFRLMSPTLTSIISTTTYSPNAGRLQGWGDVSFVHFIFSLPSTVWPQRHYKNQDLQKGHPHFARAYIRQASDKIDTSVADDDSIRLLLIGDHVDWLVNLVHFPPTFRTLPQL